MIARNPINPAVENPRDHILGTSRHHRSLPMLDPRAVALDDDSPADLLQEAIALANQLRFVSAESAPALDWGTLLAQSSADWSGFLGAADGPIALEFQRFFADPAGYQPSAAQPLATPHVALFVAFVHILRHYRNALNAFPQRHLDHYYREVLQLSPQPPQPAETYLTVALKDGEEPSFLPEGTRVLAPDLGPDVVLETTSDLELQAAQIVQRSALRVDFAPAGLRKLLKATPGRAGMLAIQQLVWTLGVGTRLTGSPWNSFAALLAAMDNRDLRRDFPADTLQLSLDEFREMMQLEPEGYPLTASEEKVLRKWEALLSRILLATAYPAADHGKDANVGDASGLEAKLSAALYNGHALPYYKGEPLQLRRLHQDREMPDTAADAVAALNYVRNVLWLDEVDFEELYEMHGASEGLPKVPEALVEAAIRKAGSLSPWMQRSQAAALAATADARRLNRHAGNAQAGWFPYGLLNGITQPGTDVAQYGLLIESPLLELSEGERNILLTMRFAPADFNSIAALFDTRATAHQDWIAPFAFEVTGDKDWMDADWRKVAPVIDIARRKITFQLAFPATMPSITAPGAKFPDSGLIGKGPLLKMHLAPTMGAGVNTNETNAQAKLFCQTLQVTEIQLEVRVSGMEAFHAYNQDGKLKVTAPFEPFGTLPGPFTELRLAHPEICMKPLDGIDLELDWMELPTNLQAYYAPYFGAMGDSPAINGVAYRQQDFTATVEMVTGRWSQALSSSPMSFFTPRLHVNVQDIEPLEGGWDADKIALLDGQENSPRYLKLGYATDWYLQRAYEQAQRRLAKALVRATDAVTAAALALANNTVQGNAGSLQATLNAAKAVQQGLADLELNAPYIPKLKGLRLGYSARVMVPLADWVPNTARQERLYHQMPFGYRQLPVGLGSPQALLPGYGSLGSVLIGFEGLEPGGSLSLLLKVQAGSGDPDVPAPPVNWKYYGAAGWQQLPSRNLLADETKGLTQTGLLKLSMPLDAKVADAELPGNLHWLMAGTLGNCEILPDWSDLHTQGVRARQIVVSDAGSQVSALPSGSVTRLQLLHPAVGSVQQPYASTKGKPQETEDDFYKRISERLRHKNRAITAWDYEHLALQQFSELYAAKALPARALAGRRPGEMHLVVIPDLRSRHFVDPFQPKLGFGELAEVSQFMTRVAPPTAIVTARNPRFRPLLVGTAVRFVEGVSASTGKHLLQQRLKEFLAPWAFDQARPMRFGGRIYLSAIVDIIQSEPYIQFVGKTRLMVEEGANDYHEATILDGDSSAYVEIEEADVLTSAAVHLIDEIASEDVKDEIWSGISWMVIGSDFVIANDPNTDDDYYHNDIGISWAVIGKDFQVGDQST